jgi:hypothetical protein
MSVQQQTDTWEGRKVHTFTTTCDDGRAGAACLKRREDQIRFQKAPLTAARTQATRAGWRRVRREGKPIDVCPACVALGGAGPLPDPGSAPE